MGFSRETLRVASAAAFAIMCVWCERSGLDVYLPIDDGPRDAGAAFDAAAFDAAPDVTTHVDAAPDAVIDADAARSGCSFPIPA